MDRKKALITGGEYGMGRGIALVLAEEGYDIAFSYYPGFQNDKKAVETSKRLLAGKGATTWAFSADLSKKDTPKQLFDQAVGEMGGLHLTKHHISRGSVSRDQRSCSSLKIRQIQDISG